MAHTPLSCINTSFSSYGYYELREYSFSSSFWLRHGSLHCASRYQMLEGTAISWFAVTGRFRHLLMRQLLSRQPVLPHLLKFSARPFCFGAVCCLISFNPHVWWYQ